MRRVSGAGALLVAVVLAAATAGCGGVFSKPKAVAFQVVADLPSQGAGRESVQLLTSADQLAAAWQEQRLRARVPAVDFDADVVVLVGLVATVRCPSAGVEQVESRDLGKTAQVRVRWTPAASAKGACRGRPSPHTLVLALPRSALGHGLVTVHLVRGSKQRATGQQLL